MTISTGVSAAKRLGDFEIVREIGRGGMGVVFEARQVSLNRKVALKVLSSSLGLSPQAIPRFRREAEAAAKLHHTNIVPVYATGAENGTYFYAMELIDGPSLDSVIRQLRQAQPDKVEAEPPGTPPGLAATSPSRQSPLAPDSTAAALTSSALSSDGHYFDTVAKMMAEVADALHYAHEQGVIHRDLKPSNLLLSPDGRLSVNDFGLARMLEQPGMTMTGEFVGTPTYMSPEQITAGRVPIDHRTDIYSLGATLYEMLTLQPPFTGERRDQVLAQILQKEPKAPRRLNRKVPLDLDTICLKAIDKDPDRRYQTAGELAADLRRYVNRFAIAARRAGPVERLQKWVKRHPALAAALALMVVAMGVAGYFGYRARVSEAQMQSERRQRALDDAIAAAMSGDPVRAESAIKDAELKGVSTGQVRFLRGLTSYQRNEFALAIEELQQAADLMPESVACQALLARVILNSTYYSGTSLKSYEALDKMDRLTPITPEDYLFRGLAFSSWHKKAEALVDLDKAIQQRDSPIARAIRGYGLNLLAVDVGDLVLSQRAQADLRHAKTLLPDNLFVCTTNLIVLLTAANLYGEAGQAGQQQAALNEAQDDVDALKSSLIIRCVRYRAIYYEQVGDEGTAIEILRQATDQQGTGELLSRYALALYRQGKIGEALEALDRRRESDDVANEFLRVVLLADLPEHGLDQAYSSFLDVVKRHQDEIGTPSGYWNSAGTLLLLGKRQEAAMIQLDDLPSYVFAEAAINARPLANYVAEKVSEEEFLNDAGDSRVWLCANHYWIGLVRLSEGDRQGAREHFEKSVAHGIYYNRFEPYCRTYLERLKQDPAWPRWIPAKKE